MRGNRYINKLRKRIASDTFMLEELQAQRQAGEVRVGDRLQCLTATPCGTVVEGGFYTVAKVSNGDVRSFVALADMPIRYWDVERFAVAS